MEGNDSYWEQTIKQNLVVTSDEDILDRIKKCQFVIDKLEQDDLWKIVLEDVDAWTNSLDDNWQMTYDDKLYQMRVLKHACVHIKNLKDGYVADLKFATEELNRRNNPETIERDMEN